MHLPTAALMGSMRSIRLWFEFHERHLACPKQFRLHDHMVRWTVAVLNELYLTVLFLSLGMLERCKSTKGGGHIYPNPCGV